MKALAPIGIAVACLGCGLFGPGGRYSPRDKSCVVKTLPGPPKRPVDDLGTVTVDCWTGNDDACQKEVLDEVCRRGGDVVWGTGDSGFNTSKLAFHVGRMK